VNERGREKEYQPCMSQRRQFQGRVWFPSFGQHRSLTARGDTHRERKERERRALVRTKVVCKTGPDGRRGVGSGGGSKQREIFKVHLPRHLLLSRYSFLLKKHTASH